MKTKYNRIISCILAVLMLFSGMCLEEKADPLFEWKTKAPVDSFIEMLDGNAADFETCTIEMLGVHNTARVVSTLRRSNLRLDIRASRILLPVGMFLNNILNVRFAVDEVGLKSLCYQTAILDFIHEKDGKK